MNPDFEQQIPLVPVLIGFVALLLITRVIRKYLRERYLRSEGQIDPGKGRIPTIEERVAANSAWARGEIKSKGGALMAGVWLLAAVWNLTFGAAFFKQLSNPEIKTGGLVVLGIFALVGLPIIGVAVYLTMRQLRYGESVCRITGKAGVLGKGIAGSIKTKAPIEAEGDFTISLQCVETYSVGTGKNRTTKVDIRWEGKQVVPHRGVRSNVGIPFTLDIPSHPPETGYQLSRGQINWQLRIDAPAKGVDYSALFVVPVFKVG